MKCHGKYWHVEQQTESLKSARHYANNAMTESVSELWGAAWRVACLPVDCHVYPETPSRHPVRRSRDDAGTWRYGDWTPVATSTSVRRARMAEIQPPILPRPAAAAVAVHGASELDFARTDLQSSAAPACSCK